MAGKTKSLLIEDIRRGGEDRRGDTVQEIYSFSSHTFVVYRAANRVRVAYADDPEMARLQRDVFAPLEVLRGEILALMEGWLTADHRSTSAQRLQSYNWRLADALGLAFRNLPEAAKAALTSVRDDLLAERQMIGRQQYFMMAVGVAAAWILILTAAARSFPGQDEFLWLIVKIVAAGCFGALFSIMLNLSSRQIRPDFLRPQNLMDALLRISIASMSAIVIYALLRARLVDLSFNTVSLGEDFAADAPVFGTMGFLACFFAGFSEMLVSNFVSTAQVALKTPQAKPAPTEADAAAGRAKEAIPITGPAGGPPPAAPTPAPEVPALRGPAGAPASATSEEDHVDGCACDMHDQHDTADEDLPPARGGLRE